MKVNDIFNSEFAKKGGLGSDKKRGGKGNFLPDIGQDKGTFTDTLTGFMKNKKDGFTNVPTDDEIK